MYTDLFKELSNILQNRVEFLSRIPDEYADLRERLEALPELEHIDLWHDQVNYLSEEHPFPTPAAFLEFNTLQVDDAGELMQTTTLQVDIHIFYETFCDSYEGAVMQDEALTYMDLLLLIGLMFHGRSGTYFHQMRRTGTMREESGGAGNLYRISFETNITEFSGLNLFSTEEMGNREISIEKGVSNKPVKDGELYLL
ncbi:hypothetical protein [Bacteroides sp.]|uniref:hypothetical protein n=1 Tax=Bacteroides sp. TaxID=29523 RepID=UPI0025BE918B|nr:hypothetical protein [Bacteroides sp.]